MFAKHLKDSDIDWLCMIDNDMQLGPNLLDTLKDVPADASIVVPVFYAWTQNTLSNKLCWGMDTQNGIGKLESGFTPLPKCGTGAIFIKPEVFKALDYPYFSYVYNEDGRMVGTEDVTFSVRRK